MPTDLFLKIAAAYIRVSDERQDEYSPDSQLKKIREYAAKEGYEIPDEYVFYDDGISGRSVKKRNDFNRMIATAKEKDHPFEKIYVWKFSRFARNQEEAIVYKSLLAKKNVSVISVSEPIPEGHFGTLIERIIEWMDEYYSINLGVEVTRGMTEKVSRGEPICPPAFGYKIREKKYYPDEQLAPIVQEIFARYADGEGMRTIAIDLSARGIRTTHGNPLENRNIEFILNNPVYIGKIRWSLNGVRAVPKRDYDNENIMIVDGSHEAIISKELWEKAQARLEREKKIYAKHAKKGQPVSYMLKGLVRCSSCGGTLAMSARSGKAQIPSLQCCNYNRGSCSTSHSIIVTRLEKAVMDGLKYAVTKKRFNVNPDRKSTPKESVDYGRLISNETKKLERSKQAYLNGVDTLEQYAETKKEIEEKIAKLRALRDAELLPSTFDSDAYAKKVMAVLEYVSQEGITPQEKNEALRTIIDRVIYDKASESIDINFLIL